MGFRALEAGKRCVLVGGRWARVALVLLVILGLTSAARAQAIGQSEANRNAVDKANDAGASVSAEGPASRSQSRPPRSNTPEQRQAQPSRATDERQAELLELLHRRRRQLEALLEETLDDTVELSELLGVNPADPLAVALQVRQWEAVLEPPATPIIANDAGGASQPAASNGLSTRIWDAQVELTRLRTRFFALPSSEQARLIEQYRVRNDARIAAEGNSEEKIAAADQRAQQASRARARALAEAEAATSEALKLLREEEARLLSVKEEQANYEADLLRRDEATRQAAEAILGWRRKVAELVRDGSVAPPSQADALYDALRAELGAARDRLSLKLSQITSDGSEIPSAGEDRVDTGGIAVERTRYDTLRAELISTEKKLRARTDALVWQEAKSLLAQTQSLNRDRLLLFPLLSAAKRDAVTSFGSAGRDQARAEWRQVRLVFRYHLLATLSWLGQGEWRPTGVLETAWMRIAWFKLMLFLLVFWSWRRRGNSVLTSFEQDLRKERHRTELQERLLALVDIYRRVRRPFEWLVFGWVVLQLLDPELRELLEVRVLWIVTSWVLGAATLVLWLNAVAARRAASIGRGTDAGDLRLRSLRVVARTVVVFGLILSLSAEFVGRGTLHTWVIGSCWFAAIPIGLVLINWWKPVIFERLTPRKNRNRLAHWIVETQTGWQSFFAAALGGGYLLGLGVVRIGRDYLIELELVRHLLAYLFQRSMTQQALTTAHLDPIDEATRTALISPSPKWLEPEGGAAFLRRVQAALAGTGGVFAVVGEWGSGKSTLLQELTGNVPNASPVIRIQCPPEGVDAFRDLLCNKLSLPACHNDVAFRKALERLAERTVEGNQSLILIDDAHRLLRPTIGGIAQLEEVLDATRQAGQFTWVFAFDHALFSLFERAYGARPAFDEILKLGAWSEDAIRELIEQRTRAAQIAPSFRLLLPRVVSGDEIDRAEKLERTRTGYYRMLWNYSAGNPAVAAFAWADSLGTDKRGHVCVGPFTSPSTADLEGFPDTSSFVLRALVRLGVADERALAEASNLSLDQVRSVLRYAKNKGYVVMDDQHRLSLSPQWFRAITRVLQRKHFLISPS